MKDKRLTVKKRIGGGASSDVYIVKTNLKEEDVVGIRLRVEEFDSEGSRSARIKRFFNQYIISKHLGMQEPKYFP
ncbi:MAG: hypothetical protein EPN82_12885 [Bacteroidetes bacterium]|nr:MAG: hypothetical protein EPN82_12885 [Bacteroidota bacterium]